jgi:hypothetical protein
MLLLIVFAFLHHFNTLLLVVVFLTVLLLLRSCLCCHRWFAMFRCVLLCHCLYWSRKTVEDKDKHNKRKRQERTRCQKDMKRLSVLLATTETLYDWLYWPKTGAHRAYSTTECSTTRWLFLVPLRSGVILQDCIWKTTFTTQQTFGFSPYCYCTPFSTPRLNQIFTQHSNSQPTLLAPSGGGTYPDPTLPLLAGNA